MKILTRVGVIIIACLLLNGCLMGTIDVIDDKVTFYNDKPDSAVIIIGLDSNHMISTLIAEKNGGKQYLSPRLLPNPSINAAAFQVRVGDTLKFNSVKIWAPELAKGVRNYGGHVSEIKSPTTLKITEKGIYHFGTVIVRGEKIAVLSKLSPKVLSMAKQRYKSVFSKLKPINFK